MIKNVNQPEIIFIDDKLRIRSPKKEEWSTAIPWYSNSKIMYYSEGVEDKIYNIEDIIKMYEYLSNVGELYFIEVLEDLKWNPIGDVTLSEENMPIAIGVEAYWGKGIGSKVIAKLIERAKFIGLNKISVPAIYHYNKRSQNLFKALGFIEIEENDKEKSYELIL